MALKVSEKLLGGSNRCFIIAEIGQNHQGNVNTAKEMIRKAAECGVDCVKFQRSNLEAKFTKSALDRLYPSPNSFGATYGDHKKFLEFSSEDFRKLKTFTEDCGLIFSASAMDPVALDELISLEVDFIKIGSGDANNFPLLEKGKLSGRPLIISTGMQDQGTIERINELMGEEPFGLLHCVSCYPTSPEDANLQFIPEFRKNFRQATVGYSGHDLETEIISLAAVAMGAKILERHFTLGKSLKGSDHKCSLEPQEMKKLVKNIREVENFLQGRWILEPSDIVSVFKRLDIVQEEDSARVIEVLRNATMGDVFRKRFPCEEETFRKLGKSLVYAKDLPSDHILGQIDLSIKVSEPKGIQPEEMTGILGRKLKKSVEFDNPIQEDDFHH